MGSLVGGHASALPKWLGNEARHISSAAPACILLYFRPPTLFFSLLKPPTFPGLCPAGPSSLPILKLHRVLLLEDSLVLSFPQLGYTCPAHVPQSPLDLHVISSTRLGLRQGLMYCCGPGTRYQAWNTASAPHRKVACWSGE